MQRLFTPMLEALTAARGAMEEVIRDFSQSGFKDRPEMEEVLLINEDLAFNAQELIDLMLIEECARDDVLGEVRDLAAYFQATERLLIAMLETAEVG